MSKSHKRKAQAKAQDKKQKKAEGGTLTLASARAPETVRVPEGSAKPPAAMPQAVTPPAASPHAATPQAAFAGAVATIEGSLKAAGVSAVRVDRKLIEIAQANVNSGLAHAKEMATATNPIAAMRLHMNYWHEQMGAFTRQSQEFRALQGELVGLAAAPLRAHLREVA
jgi:hypothetical protein